MLTFQLENHCDGFVLSVKPAIGDAPDYHDLVSLRYRVIGVYMRDSAVSGSICNYYVVTADGRHRNAKSNRLFVV